MMGQAFSKTDFWTWDSRWSGRLRVVNIGLSMLGMTPQQTRPWNNNNLVQLPLWPDFQVPVCDICSVFWNCVL